MSKKSECVHYTTSEGRKQIVVYKIVVMCRWCSESFADAERKKNVVDGGEMLFTHRPLYSNRLWE